MSAGGGDAAAPDRAGHGEGGRPRTLLLLLKLAVVMLLVFGFTFFGTRYGILPEVERTAFDMQMRSNAPREGSPVVVIRITDNDYRTYFNKQSPLNPDALVRIIGAIAEADPAVIGVDIDTSDSSFGAVQIPHAWPIVWARAVSREASGKLRPLGVLGGRRPAPCSGVVTLKAEADRVVRRYQRMFFEEEMDDPRLCEQPGTAIEIGGGQLCERELCPLPSFTWAVVNRYDPSRFAQSRPQSELSEGLAINFAGNLDVAEEEGHEPESGLDLTVQEVLDATDEAAPTALKKRFKELLQGKIVLLGGGFATARDRHATPLGLMTGVRINAQAIETEHEGGGLPPPTRAAFMLVLLAENVILVLFFQFAKVRKLLLVLLSPPLVIGLAVGCSLLAFHTYRYWVFFLPTLLILLALETYDRMKEYRNELVDELRDARNHSHAPALAATPSSLDSVESFTGTLGEYVQQKIEQISVEHERGGRSVTEVSRKQVTTSLKPEAFHVEIYSTANGQSATRRLFFFEDSDGRKVYVTDDTAE